MSEMSWVGCKVNVDCGEIGIFDGKVFEIDDNEGCMKLKNGGYIFLYEMHGKNVCIS